MRVHVDDSGRDDAAARVDLSSTAAGDVADVGDLAAADRDIGAAPSEPGAIHYGPRPGSRGPQPFSFTQRVHAMTEPTSLQAVRHSRLRRDRRSGRETAVKSRITTQARRVAAEP